MKFEPIKFPTPAEVTYETASGQKRVRWDKVDMWLRHIRDEGALGVISKALDITVLSLANRRKELGLVKLPRGRPPVADLTAYEFEVLLELRNGVSQADIARKREVSPQSISSTKATITKKLHLQDRYCAFCAGAGVRECGSDGEPRCSNPKEGQNVPIPTHYHVCQHCDGRSTYTANPK